MQLCFEDYTNKLTVEELKARDIMVNTFNPVLKFLLSESNPLMWRRYGYNSCRQTAILGAVYLKDVLPDYAIVPYEGEFTENDNGSVIKYDHCFIIASKNDRRLIVDISRTTKRLLFNVIEDIGYPYPKTGDYKEVTYLHSSPIDMIKNYEECNFTEFFTKRHPKEVIAMIKAITEHFDQKAIRTLRDSMYNKYTVINR